MEQLRCDKCETDVTTSGKCNCYYGSRFGNEQDMEMCKNNFIEVIKCCIRLSVPNLPQITQSDFPLHLNCQDTIINEMFLYRNGVQIYCYGYFQPYPITVSNTIENERSGDGRSINHQNYTLPVRVLFWRGTALDSIVEIVSHEVNWRQLLKDIELNRVQLGWHFLDIRSVISRYIDYNHCYFIYEEDSEGSGTSSDNLNGSEGSGNSSDNLSGSEDDDIGAAPPAATSAVDDLERETIEGNRDFLCCICQSALLAGEKCVKMPCNHEYHEECILQWLETTNSCPACKFELPTDDPEYEAQKQRRNG